MKVQVLRASEKQYLEVPMVVDGTPGKVLFQFDESDRERRNALISFDVGKNWIPVSIAHAALSAFIDRYPLALTEDAPIEPPPPSSPLPPSPPPPAQ